MVVRVIRIISYIRIRVVKLNRVITNLLDTLNAKRCSLWTPFRSPVLGILHKAMFLHTHMRKYIRKCIPLLLFPPSPLELQVPRHTNEGSKGSWLVRLLGPAGLVGLVGLVA